MAEALEYSKCSEHGKDFVLFCNETACQIAICTSCLTKKHLSHKVVEIEEVKQVVLLENIDLLTNNLRQNMKLLSTVKEDIKEKGDVCVDQLNKDRKALNAHFKRKMQFAENAVKTENQNIDSCLAVIKSNLDVLNDIKYEVEGQDFDSFVDILSKAEAVHKIEADCKPYLSGHKAFRYPIYMGNAAFIPLLPENISQQATTLCFSKQYGPAILWDPVVRAQQMKRSISKADFRGKNMSCTNGIKIFYSVRQFSSTL